MDTPLSHDDLSILLHRHAELEERFGDGDNGRFLSGWQCINPWADEIRRAVAREIQQIDVGQYLYLDDDPKLKAAICDFHASADRKHPEDSFCGAGASPLIFTFCAWLRLQEIQEVYYIPPLYFALHFALKLLGIRARPISGKHAFETGFSYNLPRDKTVLLVADPVWYVGIPLSLELISALAEWQAQTGSLIFVDGSFQYSRWDSRQSEFSSMLEPSRTVRLICPTKALASHGYRFAYSLLPKTMHATSARIYGSIYGSATAENLAFARFASLAMASGTITGSLMQLTASRHRSLRQRGVITAPWEPSCGYFIFEKIAVGLLPGSLLMDGSYFEQRRYPGFNRINLLSPSLHTLD